MLIAEVFDLPEKQWTPKDNQVSASILSVGQPKNDQYGFKQPIVLTDNATNVSQAMTVQTKYEDGLIRADEVGKSMMWICKWYQGKRGKCLVGYTTTKRNATQPQQPAAQLDAALDNYNRENNDKATGMVRHGVVCAYISAGVEPDVNMVNYWTSFIMTGKAPPPPGKESESRGDEYPPWEN